MSPANESTELDKKETPVHFPLTRSFHLARLSPCLSITCRRRKEHANEKEDYAQDARPSFQGHI
jgi:hypothetical protein